MVVSLSPHLVETHRSVSGQTSFCSSVAQWTYSLAFQLAWRIVSKSPFCSIENPEVHLHPEAQVAITELLITSAREGKRLIVETHSDLVVLRVLRAMLEESIYQSEVAIYFTSLTTEAGTPGIPDATTSSMKALAVSPEGRIENWPTGFLDTRAREMDLLADRLFPPQEEEA